MVTGPSLVSSSDIIGLENAGPHGHAEVAQRGAVFLVELGWLRRVGCGLDESWAGAGHGRRRTESELRNNQRRPADVDERVVHLTRPRRRRCAAWQSFPRGICAAADVSPLATPRSTTKPRPISPVTTPIHQHASLADPLDDSSHGKNAGATAILGLEPRLGERARVT